MAATNNEYKLLLGVELNEKSLQTQISKIEKKSDTVFHLKVALDFSDIKNQLASFKTDLGTLQNTIKSATSGSGGSGGNGLVLFDQQRNEQILDSLKKKMDVIRASADKEARQSITTSNVGDGEQLNKSVIQYTDRVGKAITETLTWKTNAQGIASAVKETITYTDNLAVAEKGAAAEAKKKLSLFEKYAQQADNFNAKSEQLNKSNPLVAKGRRLSQEMFEILGKGMDNLTNADNKRLKELSHDLSAVNEAVRTQGKNLQKWTTEVGIAIKRTIEWAMGIGLVYGALNQLKEGVQYVRDLNKVMTDTAIVTGMSDQKIVSLAKDYNQLARDMGATTLQIGAGALEFQRQGKTIEETNKLIRASMVMSKLGNMDSADSTEKLTATLNGFKLEASDAMGVVDKLVDFARTHSNMWKFSFIC